MIDDLKEDLWFCGLLSAVTFVLAVFSFFFALDEPVYFVFFVMNTVSSAGFFCAALHFYKEMKNL